MDLVLAAVVTQRADTATVEPDATVDGALSLASFWSGAEVVTELRVDADTATAALTRLALVAGIDPLVATDSLEGASNVGRLKLRRGADVADAVVSVGASARGLRGEVRSLSVNGRAPVRAARGVLTRCPACGAFLAASQATCDRDGAAPVPIADWAEVGGTIGPYRILSRLGEGTGGTVFAAEHALLGRPVAIKLMARGLADKPELLRRFLAEARAASRLVHPNVIEVTDYGLLADGHPYIVMERLAGASLHERLARDGAMDPKAALRVARGIALGLAASHDAGIAHNDLKPSNVVLLEPEAGAADRTPRVKLIDFGAASRVGTAEELLFGTPGYMAPERIVGAPSDGRADLYSLGVVVAEMISGQPAFGDLPQDALMLAQLRGALLPLVSPYGVLPPALLRFVDRATARKAEERHQSAAELVAHLDRVLEVLSEEGPRRWLP